MLPFALLFRAVDGQRAIRTLVNRSLVARSQRETAAQPTAGNKDKSSRQHYAQPVTDKPFLNRVSKIRRPIRALAALRTYLERSTYSTGYAHVSRCSDPRFVPPGQH